MSPPAGRPQHNRSLALGLISPVGARRDSAAAGRYQQLLMGQRAKLAGSVAGFLFCGFFLFRVCVFFFFFGAGRLSFVFCDRRPQKETNFVVAESKAMQEVETESEQQQKTANQNHDNIFAAGGSRKSLMIFLSN